MRITIPELSLLVLVGASGSGKSTFAAQHFLATEVISSDACRALVADDPNAQEATKDAFDVLQFIAEKRLAAGRLTVVDATNVQPESRRPLVALARGQHVLPVAIVLDMPERVCHERNRGRPDRDFGPHVVRNQRAQLRRSLRRLEREGFRRVFVLRSPEEVEAVEIVRERSWTDRRDDRGPFDIVGDVHGCLDELVELLAQLGYEVAPDRSTASHPLGRRAVFLGDIVDRGPDTPGVLRLVMGMVADGTALCVPGNHENKLVRALKGRDVRVTHGLAESLAQLGQEPPEFRERVREFLDALIGHFVLDDGRLVVAHAGMREEMQGRASAAVRAFALYGETTGETDEFGLPVRYPWANDYRGRAMVVYGHTPVPEPEWVNRTICVDTGCVFGGRLTALRYPERELVSVPARRTYYEPARPFLEEPAPPAEEQRPEDLLDIDDVLGKRQVETRLLGRVTVREENASAALEVMSRFAADPRWLVYLPPTMAPVATSARQDLLEHPDEAFGYFRHEGVARVMCQEKHMGSRAIAVVCRDPEVARRRFGVGDERAGFVYTRTGRPFFRDEELAVAALDRIRRAIDLAGLWAELETDWVVLDAELLPWSAKAEELLRTQYASVAAAATHGLTAEVAALEFAVSRGIDLGTMLDRRRRSRQMAIWFGEAYRRFCWPVHSIDELRLAPFQVLAAEGRVLAERDHAWHMAALDRLASADPGFMARTAHVTVDVTDPASQEGAVRWWEAATAAGAEGMVVKPLAGMVRGRKGLAQPALKVRGREYLRIIYGPEYTEPANLERLRQRTLGLKRSLAVRETALGIESLDRFVRGEPLYRVHECVFAVLALESEPVDPRL